MKKILSSLLLLIVLFPLLGQGVPEEVAASAASRPPAIIASTSWTAAFADLAGLDEVSYIAPANLAHPPEYEITVTDVVKISGSDYFLYAGYERMMQTLSTSLKKDAQEMIKINTNNSIANVKEQSAAVAKRLGTEEESLKRVQSYEQVVLEGKLKAEQQGLSNLKVYCHAMQVFLAKDLGLQVAGTFGPAPVSAAQIAEVARGGYDLIIDNIHNPIAGPLVEVSPTSKLVVWRNFPSDGAHKSLERMVQANIEQLLR